MSDEIEVSCPGCSAIFNVPSELMGEIAECSECGSVFEIPKGSPPVEKQAEPQYESTDTGGIVMGKITEEAEGATNTVKLSRTGIGMIPSLKDSFAFAPPEGAKAPAPAPPPQPRPAAAVPQKPVAPAAPPQKPAVPPAPAAHAAPQPSPRIPSPAAPAPGQARPSAPAPRQAAATPAPAPSPAPQAAPQAAPPPQAAQKQVFKKSAPAAAFTSPQPPAIPTSTQPVPVQPQQAPAPVHAAVALPPWTKIQMSSGEELIASREIKTPPFGIAFLASLPVLLAGAAVFLARPAEPMIPYAVVGGIWLLSFMAGIAIASGKSKAFFALTSTRAIFVTGKTRVELKR